MGGGSTDRVTGVLVRHTSIVSHRALSVRHSYYGLTDVAAGVRRLNFVSLLTAYILLFSGEAGMMLFLVIQIGGETDINVDIDVDIDVDCVPLHRGKGTPLQPVN